MGALAEAFDRAAAEAPAAPVEPRKGTLAQEFDAAVKAADEIKAKAEAEAKAAKVQPQKLASPPGKLMSAAAGAGEAVGRGALAVQQLIGKGMSEAGDIIAPQRNLSSLVAPPEPNMLQQGGQWLLKDAAAGVRKLEAENAPYREENPASSFGGAVVGTVLSPINRLIPMGGAATTVVGAAAKGAAQGAALSALSTPVADDKHFLLEKAQQAAVGGIGGAVGGVLGYGLSKALDKGVEMIRTGASKLAAGNPAAAAEATLGDALKQTGINAAALKTERPELFSGLRSQVEDAVKSGKPVDPAALKRLVQAQTLPVPVPMLKGQITRDPMQFAKEQNLRGIQGIGEPIKDTITAQNNALMANLDALGAKKGADVVLAGQTAIESLKAADKKASGVVSAAYKAFKDSTGKELDVPLKGLADEATGVLKEFGTAGKGGVIPAPIARKFGDLIRTAKETGNAKAAETIFSISDAEALIKSINRNYNPKDLAQSRALDDLRTVVQKAIADGAGSSAEGSAAAGLAKAARAAARERFSLIEATPALKAAIQGHEPDKFLQKFVLQGNVSEVKSMVSTLSKEDPKALASLQDSLITLIKDRVGNMRGEGNATFSSDQLKRFVMDPNMSKRIGEVLGPEKMAQLRQLYQVSENALYAPTGAAVNRSNTASAAANLVKEEMQGGSMNTIADILSKYVPGASYPASVAKAANQAQRASGLVNEAVNPSLSVQSGRNNVVDILSKNLRPDIAAQRGAAAALQERNRREAQR